MIKLGKNRILIVRTPPEEGAFFVEGKEDFKGVIATVSDDIIGYDAGDIVHYEKYDHAEITINGEDYILVKEEAIICKIEK